MKIIMRNNNDGTLTFSVPSHEDAPEKVFAISDYKTGAKLRSDVMAWGRGYGATEAEGF